MSTPIRRKFSYPIKLLPFPKAKAYPQRKNESPPTRNMVLIFDKTFLWFIPKHKSAKFLMSIFVTFLLLTDPASMKPNPALKFELG